MSHTCMFLGEFFLEFKKKTIFKKNFNFYFILYYYVKVYVKDFKIYLIFKSFEVYL